MDWTNFANITTWDFPYMGKLQQEKRRKPCNERGFP